MTGRFGPAGVPRSCDRHGRAAFATRDAPVSRVLQREPHASRVGEGLSHPTGCGASRFRPDQAATHGRRFAPPLLSRSSLDGDSKPDGINGRDSRMKAIRCEWFQAGATDPHEDWAATGLPPSMEISDIQNFLERSVSQSHPQSNFFSPRNQ